MVSRCPVIANCIIGLSLIMLCAALSPLEEASAKPKRALKTKESHKTLARSQISGLAAIRQANAMALAASRSDQFLNAAQIFEYETGRVYEVWTAPLRITALSLEPGERIINKAAGDTERWIIGDTLSGEGQDQQTQILIKPQRPGLETNMVIATNRRLYLLSLRSGETGTAFNANLRWTYQAASKALTTNQAASTPPLLPACLKSSQKRPSFTIKAKGTRPSWMPLSVCEEEGKTYILFPASLSKTEAPPVFIMGPKNEPLLANWRQNDRLYTVDKVFDRAELRLGGDKPLIVRLERKGLNP